MPSHPRVEPEPHGFSSAAPVVIRMDHVVEAPPSRVWSTLTEVERWALWHRGIHFAVLRGGFEPGTVLHWRADGMRIRSVVAEVDPDRRLGWTLRTLGARGYQQWTLESRGSGRTRLRLEESWEGVVVRLLRATLQRTLEVSRAEWMTGLAREASIREPAS